MWKNVCVPQDMNSFDEFQANSGVECPHSKSSLVCTFWLIVNNASSSLADRDQIPINSKAESKLNDLIMTVLIMALTCSSIFLLLMSSLVYCRSFVSLNGMGRMEKGKRLSA
ncbi:hypothetical protein STAS_26871 [Striga asiatica]|uniref:Uncharacterized protein n=1 Tax=Striga asiatica TaxID=4170 RepID=A0A5A7QW88_STRAF|nr:hypothetical protein STAS_26871 [Striga asiatica]